MKLYHGSPSHDITEFKLDNPRFNPVEGSGVYFTKDYRIARGYAGSEGCVYICEFTNHSIFDATSEDEFKNLFKKISKKIGWNILKLPYINETIKGMINGSYKIVDDGDSGISWQIRNLLYNNDEFNKLENPDEITDQVSSMIKDYFSEHFILKYNDKSLGLIFLCKEPSIIKIVDKVTIGSDEDEALL